MKNMRYISVLAGCFLLLFVSLGWAFGDIRYPDRPLNLRKGRSAKTAWVGSLYPGQKVRVAYMKDGWVAVFEPGETRNSESAAVGYSNAKYLKKAQTRVEPKQWGELVYTPRTLNVRSKPNIKGKRLDTLKAMEHVRIDFPDGDWTMVFSPEATIRSKMNALGFSSAKYFKAATKSSMEKAGLIETKPAKKEAPAPIAVSEAVTVGSGEGQVGGVVASPPAPAKPVAGSWGKVVTVKNKVNVRKGRTTGSRYVRTLNPGDKVRVDFPTNGWYAVFREDETVRSEKRALGYALQSLIDGAEQTAAAKPAPKPLPKAAPVAKSAPKESTDGVKKSIVIDRSQFTGKKKPDPTPDKSAHGYKYRIIEKSETKRLGETWVTIKVFLATTKLPGTEALKDFTSTIWRNYKRANKNVAVLIYLPGMDTEDLAFGVTKFDDKQMMEFWVRKATLFGTDFL